MTPHAPHSMKAFVHLLAAVALLLMTIIIHWLHNQSNLGDLDTIRLRKRERVDMEFEDVQELLDPKQNPSYPVQACRIKTNLTGDPACLAARQLLQTQIRLYMNCTNFKSQSCSYMEQAVQTIAQQNATWVNTNGVVLQNPSGSFFGKVLNDDFAAVFAKVISDAPKMLRNAYISIQEKEMIISRSYLYLYIDMAVLANMLFHVIDYFMPITLSIEDMKNRWGNIMTKVVVVLVTLFIPAIRSMDQKHNAYVMILLTIPAGIAFFWFEILLPKDGKPW